MRDAYISREANVIGAFLLAAGDRLRDSAVLSSRRSGAGAPALVVLGQAGAGHTIDVLARALGVSHSRAVRIVDDLEDDGLARRQPSPDDGRAVEVQLTRKGREAARRVQQARSAALESALADLSAAEVAQLARLAAKVLGTCMTRREEAHAICRLCDEVACGHLDGRCPVTSAGRALDLART
jgi:DNA-binding MarR family transcriptional regulator